MFISAELRKIISSGFSTTEPPSSFVCARAENETKRTLKENKKSDVGHLTIQNTRMMILMRAVIKANSDQQKKKKAKAN